MCCGSECGTLCDVERGRVWAVARNVERCAMWSEGCGSECGTLCDVERGRVWAVARNVERCAMWNEVECGLWHGMWNVVRCGAR